MTIEEKQAEIIAEFADIEEWLDRYGYIIEMGGNLPQIDEKYKTDQYKIDGCQSRVWLHSDLVDGRMILTADSDALIVKGIISLLIDVLSGHTPEEILAADLHFIDDIGLSEHLSSNRSNGLLAMIKQIRLYALAYKMQSDNAN